MKFRENATLMKHLMMVVRHGVKKSGLREEDSQRQAWKSWRYPSALWCDVCVCVCVHDYMRQHVRVFAAIFGTSVWTSFFVGKWIVPYTPTQWRLPISKDKKYHSACVCVCNMKTKSSCKESITGLWEVTVSSDDELRDVNKRGLLSS